MRAAAYVRVSTPDQKPDLQIAELSEYCSRMDWVLVETYNDVVSARSLGDRASTS